jgi:hypothetical protein
MFHKSEPGQLQQNYATTAWKITKDIIFDLFVMVMKVNANYIHCRKSNGVIDKLREYVV